VGGYTAGGRDFRRAENVQFSLYRYQDKILLSTNYVLYLPPGITVSKTVERFCQRYAFSEAIPL
jgi:hypothetical protein